MKRNSKPFAFINLFAGIGGFHHALNSLGGECVMAFEINETCRKVFRIKLPAIILKKTCNGSFGQSVSI